MGGGDNGTGGNGSVYWKTTHYDDDSQKRKLKVRTTGQPHGNDEIDLDASEALGRDANTAIAEVGTRLGHTGFFRVTLRYRTMQEAQQAGAWVAENVRPGPGGFLLEIKVPVIDRQAPMDNPPFEVMVEW
jgi:hypothetical protein